MKQLRQVMLLFLLGSAFTFTLTPDSNAQWVAYNDFAWATPDPDGTGDLYPGPFAGQVDFTLDPPDPEYRVTPNDIDSPLAGVTLYTDSNIEQITNACGFSGNADCFVNSLQYYAEAPFEVGQTHAGFEFLGPEQADGGPLRNYNTGSVLTATASVNHTGTTYNWVGGGQGAGVAPVPGTDAYAEFYDQNTGEPIVGLRGLSDGGDVNSTHTVTLANLDPNKFYEYTTFGNFGHWVGVGGNGIDRGGTLWRRTSMEGHDPDGFQNLSSVDTDYATAINVDASATPLGVDDPRHSVGHEQRAVIRSVDDPHHYVQNSGEIYFDGWVTKFHFKPGADGTVDIVTVGVSNHASMEYYSVVGSQADMNGVPLWKREYITDRSVENLIRGDLVEGDPLFGENYRTGWVPHSDPNQWPADPDALDLTVHTGPDVVANTASVWYLNAFKLEELAAGLAGDFDQDGDVDGADFLVWQRNPGVGNLTDWQTNYGIGALVANSTSVPEPTSALLLLSAIGLFVRRSHLLTM